MTSIDAHLHLWDPQLGVYSWLTPDLGPLHERFTAEQARAELDAAGVDLAVPVGAIYGVARGASSGFRQQNENAARRGRRRIDGCGTVSRGP